MTKEEFKKFIKEECYKRGFKKIKNAYYLVGKELLCSISLQKSNFANVYYVNYRFYIGDYVNINVYPTQYERDIYGRILAMSKLNVDNGKNFMTSQIEYEEYTEDELRPFFDKEFNEKILPPIYQGKKYILDNLNKLYYLDLNPEEVMRELTS